MQKLFPQNYIFKAFNEGRVPVGTFNYIRDTTVIEILGEAGLDFVIIDTEHAVMNRETVERQIIAAQLCELTPLVRIPSLEPAMIRSYLEMGAQGIMVPHVSDGKTCRKAQDAMRYPPAGHASTCRSHRSDGFNSTRWLDYLGWVEQASLIAMIEEPEALRHLDEILDELKPGRDMVMFGKADYTQALGLYDYSGNVNSTEVNEAAKIIVDTCNKRGIAFLIVPAGHSQADVQTVVDNGGKAICIDVDQTMLLRAYKDVVNNSKAVRLK